MTEFNEKPAIESSIPKESSAAITSLVIGIISLIVCWLPFIGIILGILAIIFGIKGQKDKNKKRAINNSFGIAGIVIGMIAVVFGVIFTLLVYVLTTFVAK